ncbi:MAG: DUF1573 domain-containing protein [Phycisphaerales bacterium]
MQRNIGRAFGLVVGLSAMLSVCGTAVAQNATPATQPPAQPPATAPAEPALAKVESGTLVFDQESLDLGTITQNELKNFEFTFKNTGKAPVVIKEVKRSCGCTQAKVAVEGSDKGLEAVEQDQNTWVTVPAGAKAVIKAEFDPKGKIGSQSKTITVVSNDAERAEVVLTFTVQVEAVVIAEPTVLNFGTVERGNTKSLKLTVLGRTPDFLATDATVTMSELFDIKRGETREVERGGKKLRATEFDITLKANGKSGRANDVLHVRTNDSREPMKSVSLTFNIQGLLALEPTQLSLSTAKPGEPMSGEAVLKHRKDQAFKILKIETAPVAAGAQVPEFKLEFEPVDAANTSKWRVKASTTAPADRPSINVFLRITTDVGGEELVQVRCYGVVRRNQVGAAPTAPAPVPAAAPASDQASK